LEKLLGDDAAPCRKRKHRPKVGAETAGLAIRQPLARQHRQGVRAPAVGSIAANADDANVAELMQSPEAMAPAHAQDRNG